MLRSIGRCVCERGGEGAIGHWAVDGYDVYLYWPRVRHGPPRPVDTPTLNVHEPYELQLPLSNVILATCAKLQALSALPIAGEEKRLSSQHANYMLLRGSPVGIH